MPSVAALHVLARRGAPGSGRGISHTDFLSRPAQAGSKESPSMLTSLIVLLIVAVIAFWAIEQMQVPHPFNWLLRMVIGLFILLYALRFLPAA